MFVIIYLLTKMLAKKRKEGRKMLITSNQAKAIRRKQADLMLTNQIASKQIGINPITYRKVINGGEVKKSIYQKVMEWLVEDY